jgi:hypothetical protein
MSNLVLEQKDALRAERLFSERIAGAISTGSVQKVGSQSGKSISRMIGDTRKYRIVHI